MQQNFALFDFKLTDEQMSSITALDQGETGRTGPNPEEMNALPGRAPSGPHRRSDQRRCGPGVGPLLPAPPVAGERSAGHRQGEAFLQPRQALGWGGAGAKPQSGDGVGCAPPPVVIRRRRHRGPR